MTNNHKKLLEVSDIDALTHLIIDMGEHDIKDKKELHQLKTKVLIDAIMIRHKYAVDYIVAES